MIGYIKALRLPVVLLSGLLCLTSFKIVGGTGAVLSIVFTVLLASSCMAQNDWRDRKHDRLKGKTFASNNGSRFLLFVVSLWLLTCLSAIFLCVFKSESTWLAMLGIFCGLIYSETKRMLIVPALTVAFTSGIPVLLAGAFPYPPILMFLFLSTVLLILGREILKDVDDAKYDAGYKWTLPIFLGCGKAKMILALLMILACLSGLAVSMKIMPGIAFWFASATYLGRREGHKTAKSLIDIGMLLSLIILAIFGP